MEEAKEEALVFIDEDENVLLEEMPHESADNTQDDATDDNDLASFYEDEFSLEHRVQNTNQ
ncbi:MAG: hypothetical protein J5861_05315, partial [Desulfovibrio sp.]|nr:hypothetical protein [Desulfovibrio sp.]